MPSSVEEWIAALLATFAALLGVQSLFHILQEKWRRRRKPLNDNASVQSSPALSHEGSRGHAPISSASSTAGVYRLRGSDLEHSRDVVYAGQADTHGKASHQDTRSDQNWNFSNNSDPEEWKDVSPLKLLGYQVGTSSRLTLKRRHEILESAMIDFLPNCYDETYIHHWGTPGTKRRFRKIEQHLSWLIRYHGSSSRNLSARRDWEADLKWFRKNFESRYVDK